MLTYEWKLVETPQLIKDGKTITCTMDNFIPLFVPGLSSSSSGTSASASRSKDQFQFFRKIQNYIRSSDHSTCQACMRETNADKPCYMLASEAVLWHKDETDTEDPTQGIPDWLQSFTAYLEDLETHAPAHSSEREISDSECDASKVVTEKRKHSIQQSLPLRPKLRHAWESRLRGFLAVGSIPRVEKFDHLMTADHKVLNEGSESQSNHRYVIVIRDLVNHWIESNYPCKKKNSQETEKSIRKFPEPSQKSKSYTYGQLTH